MWETERRITNKKLGVKGWTTFEVSFKKKTKKKLINKRTNGCRLKSRTGESLEDSEQGNE